MKRVIYKSTALLPIYFIYYILTICFITITIPELNLYWSPGYTATMFIIFTIIWARFPLKDRCCKGDFIELLYNFTPISMLSFLFFAQYHFTISLVLAALLIMAVTMLIVLVKKNEKKQAYSEKRSNKYKNILARCSIVLLSATTIVPCFMSMFVYKFHSPEYMAKESISETFLTETNIDDEMLTDDPYEENIHLFKLFEEDKWSNYSIDEKVTVMQDLADFETEQLGIPTLPIIAVKLDSYTLGAYSPTKRDIHIDVEHLSTDGAEKCVQTLCHEVFHSAQYYITENVDWEDEIFKASYFSEIRSWKANTENYQNVTIDDYDSYRDQPLEYSAREYAEQETKKIFSYIGE